MALPEGLVNTGGTVSTDVAGTLASELLELMRRPSWSADAACQEHPEVDFFPDRGTDTRSAKAVCAGCLVRSECLAYALEHRERHGIWGGTSERERRRMRTSAPRVKVERRPCVECGLRPGALTHGKCHACYRRANRRSRAA